jgi:RNA polymerase sigma-70 factor (ECF subfamily)
MVLRAQGSPRAFEPLYLRYRDPIINYCSYRIDDPHEAEDAASAIFMKAMAALPRFRDRDGSFRSWLFRIAHNEMVDRTRRRDRRRLAPIELFAERPAEEGSPEELAADGDAHTRIRILLLQLPPREREVLELRAADLDTEQIAAVLGITVQNVRSVQCRASKRLRALLKAGKSGLETSGV